MWKAESAGFVHPGEGKAKVELLLSLAFNRVVVEKVETDCS